MKKTITILMIIIFTNGSSQIQNSGNKTSRNIFKFQPTSLVPDYFPGDYNTYSFAFEKGFGDSLNNSIEICLGYSVFNRFENSGIFKSPPTTNINGFQFQLEYRKYLNNHKIRKWLCVIDWPLLLQLNSKNDKLTGKYFSFHFMYYYLAMDRFQRIVVINNPLPNDVIDNYYSVYRHAIAAHIKWGFQSINKNNIVFDQNIGIGVRFISSSFSDSRMNGNVFFNDVPYNKPFDYGNKLFFSLNYQIKIGYLFNKDDND